uniref:Uncharacterized protein n=1 Tax=Erinnyis ello granulovirus TaxID=307444 RepID=A0A288WHR9_9BBAC|nr:hypothetical protein EREL_121 [Erinnyis ello granulovirus]
MLYVCGLFVSSFTIMLLRIIIVYLTTTICYGVYGGFLRVQTNYTILSPQLAIAPQYFSVQLYKVSSNVATPIVYTPNTNGDRLRVNPTTNVSPVTLQMFAANDGYILRNHYYNDQLCLDQYKNYKMLTRPPGKNLPSDCVLHVEMVSYSPNTNTQITYNVNQHNQVCTNATFVDRKLKFRLYIKISSVKWYVVVSKAQMTSTSLTRKATVFSLVYDLCLNKFNGNFVCMLLRKHNDCEYRKKFEDKVEEWRRQIVESTTIKVTTQSTTTQSTTTQSITTESTTTTTTTRKPKPKSFSETPEPKSPPVPPTTFGDVFSFNDLLAELFNNTRNGVGSSVMSPILHVLVFVYLLDG